MYVCRRGDISSVCLCVCENIGMIRPTFQTMKTKFYLIEISYTESCFPEYNFHRISICFAVKERFIDHKTMGKIFLNTQVSLLQDFLKGVS